MDDFCKCTEIATLQILKKSTLDLVLEIIAISIRPLEHSPAFYNL